MCPQDRPWEMRESVVVGLEHAGGGMVAMMTMMMMGMVNMTRSQLHHHQNVSCGRMLGPCKSLTAGTGLIGFAGNGWE